MVLPQISEIELSTHRKFGYLYDESGGLKNIVLPSGTKHSFSSQTSLGFIRYTYTPPGSTRAYLQHYSYTGALLQTVYPGDGARVLYRYRSSGQLSQVHLCTEPYHAYNYFKMYLINDYNIIICR